MKGRVVVLALAAVACAHGYTYAYDYAPVWDSFWYHNGDPGAWGPTVTQFFSVGSMIYNQSPYYPSTGANPNDYEIKTKLAIKAGGGTFIHYLRASSDALAFPTSCVGSYYSVEVYAPYGLGYYTNPWAGQLNIRRCVSGTLSTIAGMSLAVWDGMTLRSVVWGTTLWVYVDGHLVMQQTLSSTTGQPGIGGYRQSSYDSGFLSASIGPHDAHAPLTISPTGIRSSVFPMSISLDWQGAPDDSSGARDGGIGVYGYNITRNGTSLGMVTGASYNDSTVSASTAYTYTIAAVDFHGNTGTPVSLTVTTPSATAVDPRRTGLLTTGAYWGGGGEQIDMLSGNLNFSLPLVKAQGRTGWSIPVGLVYNVSVRANHLERRGRVKRRWRHEKADGAGD